MWESLRGETLAERALALVQRCANAGLVVRLLDAMVKARPVIATERG